MQPEETAEVVASAVPSVQQPNAAVSTPEVSIRTKRRSVKVTSSGQQTTLTFQKKSSANSDENKNPRRIGVASSTTLSGTVSHPPPPFIN
jgi:hypothetical protein